MEINRSYFISADYIKQSYPSISTSVDDNIIKSSIIFAQDLNLLNVIGDDLYEQTFLNKFSGETFYTNLVIKVIENWTLYHLMDELTERIKPVGVQQLTAENSTTLERTSLKAKQNKYQQLAEKYSTKLQKYIYANIDKFNEYQTNTEEKTKPNRNSTFGFDLSNRQKGAW